MSYKVKKGVVDTYVCSIECLEDTEEKRTGERGRFCPELADNWGAWCLVPCADLVWPPSQVDSGYARRAGAIRRVSIADNRRKKYRASGQSLVFFIT